jgi:hypothetical protein
VPHVILGTIAWLAYSGYGANKSYYVTIAELGGMGDKAYHSQSARRGLRSARLDRAERTHVDFVLNEFESHSPKAASGRLLKVSYKGSEPPPDTFKDDSQALADGHLWPRRRLPCHGSAGQVRQQVRAAQPGAQPPGSSHQPGQRIRARRGSHISRRRSMTANCIE